MRRDLSGKNMLPKSKGRSAANDWLLPVVIVSSFGSAAFADSTAALADPFSIMEPLPGVRGELVIDRKKKCIIKTHVGDVTCAIGTSALVLDSSKAVAVYNLDSKNSNDISMKLTSGQILPVGLGQELLVPRQQPAGSFAEINPDTRIAVRNPVMTKLGSAASIYYADFSIASAMTSVGPLHYLAKTKPARYRLAMERILKNGAALLQVTSRHGAYTVSSNSPGK